MKRSTVRDVAQLAGVSPKTVSNVVNGGIRVSPQTRDRVERALVDLDYVPNLSARGLRNGRTGVIALALPDLSTPYSAQLAQQFVRSAAARGWSVQIQETGTVSPALESELLSRARSHLIDGLILNPVRLESTAVQLGVELPPVVLIGEVDQPIADHVWIDNVAATRALTELLIAQRHTRIAVLGKVASATSDLRVQGYCAALAAAGLQPEEALQISCRGWSAEGGYAGMRAWLVDHEPPDGLVCFTDSLALGALHALRESGLSVPGDVSVVGYDDVLESAHYSPPLTTVAFDKSAFAETALTALADRIATQDGPVRSLTVPFQIVERESTRPR